jgi:O-antigen/teichoic acid export membrane protein
VPRDARDIDVGREALISLGAKLVGAGFGFAGSVVFARALGPDEYGIYAAAMAGAYLVVQVSGGIGGAVRKRVSEVDVEPGRYLGTGIAAHGGLTVAVLVTAIVFRGSLSQFLGSRTVLWGAVLVVGALGLFQVVNRAYAGLGYPGRSTGVDTLRTVGTVGVQALLVFWVGWEAEGLLLGLAAATGLLALGSLHATGVRPSLPDREAFRRLYTFARYQVPASVLTNAYSEADKLVLKAVAASTVVGHYTVASQLVMPASMLAGSIGDALGVKVSGISSAGENFRDELANATAYAGLFAVPMLFGALALQKRLVVTIYGPAYSEAWPAVVGLAAFQVFNSYGRPFEATFSGSDRPRIVFWINAVVLVVHLPLAIWLGITEGLLGVVAATVVAEGVRLLVYQVLVARQTGAFVLPRPVIAQVGAGIVTLVSVLGVRHFVTITGWPRLLAAISLGAGAYFGALWLFSPHFRATAVGTIGPYVPD